MKPFSVVVTVAWLSGNAMLGVNAHSWIEKVESTYGEGASRVGMDTRSDSYLQRYFCPLSTLEECQPDPKHNIVLDQTAMRPCRSDMVSDPKASIPPGTELTMHWAGNGHVGNGQSDGTCVKVMIAPFQADPSYEVFDEIPGGECLDFWITDTDGSQQPQGTINIPETLAQGSYTLLWYWGFTEFWYSACVDIDVTENVVPGTPPPTPVVSELDDGEIQVYLHNGCGDMEGSTQFCQQYTTVPNSYCLPETDECGRSICYGVGNFLFPCPVCPVGCPRPEAFYDDFSSGLDTDKWLIAEKSWGGGANGFTNGGVVAENVVANATAGNVVFNAHGSYYNGNVMGINKDLTRQNTGVRTGGAMATRQYFGAGSYEVRMKVAPELGVCSAIWTFFYNDDAHCSSGDPIVNHEIDIELPGRPGAATNNIDFSQALLNNWIGEIGSLYETGYTSLGKYVDDNSFHVWRFDWHTDAADRRVEFYLDGEHLRTMKNSNVPFYAGRLWIGAWFPNSWAGEANFAEAQMELDYVKFTPFDELYECPDESYPDFGWASGTDFGVGGTTQLCGPNTPSTSSPVTASTPSPFTSAPSRPPVASSYLNDGCGSLPPTFCASRISGSYCKDWSQDGCGRSICQGESHDMLNACPGPDTPMPSTSPTRKPTPSPTKLTPEPSTSPTPKPTSSPTKLTPGPSTSPTPKPTSSPTKLTPGPSTSPTPKPTVSPTKLTPEPSTSPTRKPTVSPTKLTPGPSTSPTRKPTVSPTKLAPEPSTSPTRKPTVSPTKLTMVPSTSPTRKPTVSPTKLTPEPSTSPTQNPTVSPTPAPYRKPTEFPTSNPTVKPSASPTYLRTPQPTKTPSKEPTNSSGGCGDYTNKNRCNAQSPVCEWYQQGSSKVCRTNPVWIYLNEGCTATALPGDFCFGYNGGYCKSWQADECGRSICHGDAHSSLNAC